MNGCSSCRDAETLREKTGREYVCPVHDDTADTSDERYWKDKMDAEWDLRQDEGNE